MAHLAVSCTRAICSRRGSAQCSAEQCSAVQCSAVQCSAVQCSAVQCRAVQEWNDCNMRWDESEYGGLKDIRMPPSTLWKPDILMYNRYAPIFSCTYILAPMYLHQYTCTYLIFTCTYFFQFSYSSLYFLEYSPILPL
jgi:hypothetical protein